MATHAGMPDFGRAIDEFCAEMRAYGLETTDTIDGDGKLHRFHVTGDPSGDKSGWYVLHLDSKPVGKFGCNRRYPDESFVWQDKSARRPMTLEERRELKARMTEQSRLAAEELAKRHSAAAERANELWNRASPEPEGSDFQYALDKGVKAYGLRRGAWEYVNDETGEVSVVTDNAWLIPIRDRQNQIHSLQAIFPDSNNFLKRRKDYLKNGAKRGYFHAIGRPLSLGAGPVFIICEGYATGASIHMATGHCVLVAFDVGNMAHVAQNLRERRPDAVLVIAADNDQWTLKPTPNPGLAIGRETAQKSGAALAYPPFTDADGYDKLTDKGVKRTGPTDFNDYHEAWGLEAVAGIIQAALEAGPVAPPESSGEPQLLAVGDESEPPPPSEPPEEPSDIDPTDGYDDDVLVKNQYFTVLGYDQDSYFFFHHAKGQVLSRTRRDLNPVGLVELAPLNWWQEYFPANNQAKIDHLMAFEWVTRRAHSMPIYDPTRVRGRGAWTDDKRIVYHHGPYLSVDGQRVALTDIKSGYVYTRAKSLPIPHERMLTNEEGAHLVEVATMPRWRMEGSAALMSGWVMLAPVCGALTWRPHIWISGGAGTGKTTLQAQFCGALTKGTNIYAQGNSTEAGIRQVLCGDALPVMIDEFESNDEKERVRVENVMSMIRQTSSETQAKTYKGTTTGSGIRFDIRSMFALSSINTNLPTKADIDRLTVLRLKASGEDHWYRLEAELNALNEDPDIANRLLARALALLPVILTSVKVFRRVAAKHFDRQRDGDQFGTLLAGCWCLQYDHAPSDEEAAGLINRYDWSEHREEADVDEADKAVGALLNAKLRLVGGLEVTVFDLIRESSQIHRTGVVEVKVAEETLRRHGIIANHGRKLLIVGTSVPNLLGLVRGLSSITDFRGQLLRVAGADKGDSVSFNGAKSKVVAIPLSPILGDDPDQDDPF